MDRRCADTGGGDAAPYRFHRCRGRLLRSADYRARKENYKKILQQGLQVLSKAGFAANGEVLVGETINEITSFAKKIEADLIVVGHKHLDSMTARWWRGSSSGALIEHAHCSVLVAITT